MTNDGKEPQREDYQPLNVTTDLTLNADREDLGREVRRLWVEFCEESGDTKPSHLAPWEDLTEWEKEADRRIGEGVAKLVMTNVSDDSPLVPLSAFDELQQRCERKDRELDDLRKVAQDLASEFLTYEQHTELTWLEQGQRFIQGVEGMRKEIADLENANDPQWDATDAAHPAWWRAHFHTAKAFAEKVKGWLEGKDDGGKMGTDWQTIKDSILSLRSALAAKEEEVEGIISLLQSSFLTCNSISGEYFVKVKFETLEQAQELHRLFVNLRWVEAKKGGEGE